MEKGDTPQQQPDNDKNATAMSPADLEAAESMLAKPTTTHPARRQPSSRCFPSSKGAGKGSTRTRGIEMTTYSAVSASKDAEPDSIPHAAGSKPSKQGGARTTVAGSSGGRGFVADGAGGRGGGGSGGRGGAGVYEEETVGLTEESSLTDSPSSAAGVSTGSGDHHRAGLLGGGKPGRPALASQPRGGGRKGLASCSTSSSSSLAFSNGSGSSKTNNSHGHSRELSGGARGEYDEHPGVRRRALSSPSSPRHELLARSASISSSEGLSGRVLPENGGGASASASHQQFEWKTKALWYLGAVLLVGGSLVNFASFGFAPQSLLASLGSVQFISNVVFGKVILREIVTRRIIVGTATIILGNTLTLCFSPQQVYLPLCVCVCSC